MSWIPFVIIGSLLFFVFVPKGAVQGIDDIKEKLDVEPIEYGNETIEEEPEEQIVKDTVVYIRRDLCNLEG